MVHTKEKSHKGFALNINSLLQKIELYERLTHDTGFIRDLSSFHNAIQQGHNRNIVFLKDVTQKILNHLQECKDNDLDHELQIIIRSSTPIIVQNSMEILTELYNNPSVNETEYFNQLNTQIASMINDFKAFTNEINTAKTVLEKYSTESTRLEADKEEDGLVSLIFNDEKSIGDLKHFSRQLSRWNTTLKVYQGLISSETPVDIELETVQEGCLDVIVSLNIDVAVDLTKIVYAGLFAFGGYLKYKLSNKEIEATYGNNERLLEIEKEKERLMLENIGVIVEQKIKEQHEAKLEEDTNINTESTDKKIKVVSEMITSHIIKGNEVKLLTPPDETFEGVDQAEEENISVAVEKQNAQIRHCMDKIDTDAKTLLLENYKEPEIEEEGIES